MKKYGKENFVCEILEWCETEEELNEKEIYYIEQFRSNTNECYNLAAGGSCGDLRKYMTEDEIESWKHNLSEAHKGIQAGENHPMYGKHHSEESKLKNSLAHSGENNPNYGKHLSEDTRRKISEKAKLRVGPRNNMFGTHPTEQTILKRKAALSKKVLNLDTNEIFNSILEAGKAYNIASSCIVNCCKGKTKTAAKQHWSYV